MKAGDLVAFDADIIKRIFPVGLSDGDMGTVLSECIPDDLILHIETPCWWILWWTGDHAGKKIYCEEQYLRLICASASTNDR